MYLFLNAVSKNWILILFDKNKEIIITENISILLEESSKLSFLIDNFFKKNNILYNEISNIVVVNWPGSFTWVRSISLVVNTLSYIFENIKLTPVSYFDLFENYPIIKTSSKRDLFIKKSKNNIIEIIKNEDFIDYIENNNIKEIYWEFFSEKLDIKINNEVDYKKLISKIIFEEKKQIEAFYVKKPSIN